MNLRNSDHLTLEKKYLKFLKKKEIKSKPIIDKIGKFNYFYLPITNWIFNQYKRDKAIKIIGLSGGQGAGKSTITSILKFIFKEKYGLSMCVFSIDDFYKTKKERVKMSKNLHPLFLTRGVPGTHDINLINKTLRSLKSKNFRTVNIPKFDKAIDDRMKKKNWNKIKKPPNIIIFEGWCVGAKHQKSLSLRKPINFIEKKYDKNLKWRKKINYYLKKDYKSLFKKIDKLIYLKAPDFNHIYKWRLHQEEKLKLTSKNKKTMSKSQIKKFIMFYERITRQMMKDYSKISDLTVFLDNNHRSKKMKFY